MLKKIKEITLKEFKIEFEQFDEIQKEKEKESEEILQDLNLKEVANFNPNLVNTANLYQLLWLYKSDLITLKDIEHTDRIKYLLKTSKDLGILKKSLIDGYQEKKSDSFCFPTIIIALPYMNPYYKNKIKESIYQLNKQKQPIAKNIKQLKFIEQNINDYNYYINQEKDTQLKYKESSQTLYEKKRYLLFLDVIGYLHSSFETSPYIRLPERGSSLNQYISRLSPSQYKKTSPNNNYSIARNIKEIGKALSKNIPPEVLDFLKNYGDGIFAISDLPLEWLLVQKVPLAFLCDVCRIPETGITSTLSQFNTNSKVFYSIEEDILSKTLVICGAKSDDPIFDRYKTQLEKQQVNLSYTTAHVESKDEFFDKVNAINPHLLVIDSHGNFESQEEGSYIWIGDEKVTGDEIINNLPSIPLVILSCCWGTPIYGNSNTIAQAFFEKGTLSVLSTFLPISIDKGFLLYFRILNNLSNATKNGLHKSWMNFLSHTIRTAYFDDLLIPVFDKIGKKVLNNTKYLDNRVYWQASSMYLEYRSKMYKEVNDFVYDSIKEGYKKRVKRLLKNSPIIPEFMLYTHLGRGDLIKFQSWLKANNFV